MSPPTVLNKGKQLYTSSLVLFFFRESFSLCACDDVRVSRREARISTSFFFFLIGRCCFPISVACAVFRRALRCHSSLCSHFCISLASAIHLAPLLWSSPPPHPLFPLPFTARGLGSCVQLRVGVRVLACARPFRSAFSPPLSRLPCCSLCAPQTVTSPFPPPSPVFFVFVSV